MNELISLRQTEFADFEALRDSVQDGPSDIVQLEPGSMTGKLLHMSIGSLGASIGTFTRGLRQRGVLSETRWIFAVRRGAPALMMDYEWTANDLVILPPGHEYYARYFDADNWYTVVLIEPDELDAFLATQPDALDAAVWQQPGALLASDPATAGNTIKQMSLLMSVLTKHGPRLSANTADFYKRNILELMTAPVRKGARDRGPRLKSPVRLVREVDRFLADAGARPVHVSELCSAFNVPRRTLHRAFDEVLGMPPIAFLRRKRLGDVHAALLAASGPDVMIREIAIEHGFVQLGRFAAAYRQMFGELPSETLRRSIS
jgi:AraC-like DNA-binding protein